MKSESEVTQPCPTLWDPMACSLPGFSVHGIFQARVLEWVTISFSRRSSRPRDWTQASRTVGRRFTVWATREVLTYEHTANSRHGRTYSWGLKGRLHLGDQGDMAMVRKHDRKASSRLPGAQINFSIFLETAEMSSSTRGSKSDINSLKPSEITM